MKEAVATSFTRIFDILTYQADKYPQKKALNKFANGQWKGYSIKEIQKQVDALSCWLLENDYQKGDNVVIIPEMGRPEWMIFDFACQQIGVVLVPIPPTATDKEFEHILSETSAKLCLTANSGLYYKINLVAKNLNISLDIKHIEQQTQGYFEGLKITKVTENTLTSLQQIKNNISENDVVSIMYTSGTSGIPKGVILTHANFVSNILSIFAVFPLEHSKKVLSFLPFSHILERTACYTYIAFGVSLYFSNSRDSFLHDFKTVKPYFCTMVPRILEKMYDYLQEQLLEKNWLKRMLIRRAFTIAKNFKRYEKHSFLYRIELFIVRVFVLNKGRKQLGGKMRYIAVGAAALRPEIARFFSAAKIRIREGYGMTETSPLISINRFNPGLNKFGTVGIPVPGVQVKIDSEVDGEEGEILVKGPNVTQGYYKRDDLTKDVFTSDGWLKTGDIGVFTDKKFLKITDRKKDIFKTSSGKYIAPQPLENHFVRSSFVMQCLIIGFNRPYVTSLIVANFSILEKWCMQEDIHWTSAQFMVLNIKVRAKIKEEIDKLNEELPNYKRIKNFVLCDKEWTIESGEMTSSYKPLRKILIENNQKAIEKMYKKL
ncbi:MAG: long-chain fatty acid--CoA ligase [Bacteroidales bacterium]|jgi:long-chain acyl-CoA synthetase|nr:long-chain fatty acid--CoA ligase [Bacteroidales bacterium]